MSDDEKRSRQISIMVTPTQLAQIEALRPPKARPRPDSSGAGC